MKKTIMLSTVLFFLFEYGTYAKNHDQGEIFSPDKSFSLLWKCQQGENCDIFEKDTNGSQKSIGLLKSMPSPSIKWINKNTAQIYFSCGNFCNTSFFYNRKIGLSEGFDNVIASDGVKMNVAVGVENNINFYSIGSGFTEPFCSIKRNWSPAMALAVQSIIEEANFDSDGNLSLTYNEGDSFKKVSELIYVNDKAKCK